MTLLSRRSVLAAAATSLVAARSFARSDERVVFGHILAESTAHHRNLLWAAEQFEVKLGRKYRLEVYPRGLLGQTDMEVIEGFKSGLTDMAYLSFGHIANLYGPISIGAAPFIFRDFGHWEKFRDSGLFKELVEGFEQKAGIHVLGLAYYGQRHISSKRPIRSLDDIKGLVIRVPNIPTMLATFRWLNAKPVAIPFHEVYDALQSGLVEAQENPLPAIRAMHFQEVTPYITLTAHIADAQLVVIRSDRWDAIEAEDRQVFTEVFSEMARRVTADVRREELELLQEFRSMSGIVVEEIDRTPLATAVRNQVESDSAPWGAETYRRLERIH